MRSLLRRKLLASGSCLIVALALLSPTHAFGQIAFRINATNADPEANHSERSLAAVDLAIIAAESGIMDVSLEAVKRAVSHGPPVASMELGGLFGSSQNRRSAQVVMAGRRRSQTENPQIRLAERLLKLHGIWKEVDIDVQLAYEAWKELILPSGRPGEAFAYSTIDLNNRRNSYSQIRFDVDRPKPIPCGAEALVHWARAANQVEDLQAEISRREPMSGATSTVMLLKVVLAQDESTSTSEAEELCKQLSDSFNLLVDGTGSQLLTGHVVRMLDRLDEDSKTRQDLIENIFEQTKNGRQWAANEWLQYLVAKRLRDAVTSGDAQALDEAAQIAMSRYEDIRASNGDYVSSVEAGMYGEAAKRAFEAGRVDLGIECLRRQSKVGVSGRRSPQLVSMLNPSGTIGKQVLGMTPEQRGTLLEDFAWNMPLLGLEWSARMHVTESIPAVFKSHAKDTSLQQRQLKSESTISISVLEWAMRDALANGNEESILSRIAKLEDRGSDDAKLARLVLQLAQNKPLNLDMAVDESDNSFVQVIGRDANIVPLDLELARQALANEAYHDRARDHVTRMMTVAIERNLEAPLTWLRKLLHDDDVASNQHIITDQKLLHWVVANDLSSTDLMSGRPHENVWVRRGGDAWGHEFGTHVSYLLLKYPLKGDFSISFRKKDGPREEGGAMFGGIVSEFFGENRTVRTWGIGMREYQQTAASDIEPGAFNEYQLMRSGKQLKVIVVGDDKHETVLADEFDACPFFGFCSYGFRATTFDSVRIEGNPAIPESVSLLSPSLMGWTAKFKQQRLPMIAYKTGMKIPEIEEGEKLYFDWHVNDGVLESIDHVQEETPEQDSKVAKQRTEGLLQYIRPLLDGDEVSFEFYYEPNKFSLFPAIGRIAIDFTSGENVGLQWITADPKGGWTGLPSGHQIVDESASQPNPIQLKENEWNQVTMRFEGTTLRVTLNDQLIYQREWEKEAGRKLGMYHDPTKFHVRVRSLTLRGPWPDKLPQDLFELQDSERGR